MCCSRKHFMQPQHLTLAARLQCASLYTRAQLILQQRMSPQCSGDVAHGIFFCRNRARALPCDFMSATGYTALQQQRAEPSPSSIAYVLTQPCSPGSLITGEAGGDSTPPDAHSNLAHCLFYMESLLPPTGQTLPNPALALAIAAPVICCRFSHILAVRRRCHQSCLSTIRRFLSELGC